MRRLPWTAIALALVLSGGLALWATGRLELHWSGDAHTAADKDEHGHGEGEEESSRIKGDKAVLDAEAVKAGGIKSEPAKVGSVAVALSALGEVQSPDDRIAHVTPRVSGVVREIYKARGERVKTGDALAAIDSADLADARAALDAARTERDLAERNAAAWRSHQATPAAGGPVGWIELEQALAERRAADAELSVADRAYTRMKELEARGLRSRTELLAAEAELTRAQTRGEAAKSRVAMLGQVATVDLGRATQRLAAAETRLTSLGGDPSSSAERGSARVLVRSPIAGVVMARDLTLGQTVEPTARVFSIADPSEVWVTAAIFDQDVASVRPDQPATIRVQGLGDTVFKGRVVQVGPQVDEKTRTLPVRVAIRNGSGGAGALLRPGMFATVELEKSRAAGRVVVPVAAIQTVGGESVVFVETPLGESASYQRRPVKTGARDGEVVEIVDGLGDGERVVVSNAYLLKSEFERSKIGQGHGH